MNLTCDLHVTWYRNINIISWSIEKRMYMLHNIRRSFMIYMACWIINCQLLQKYETLQCMVGFLALWRDEFVCSGQNVWYDKCLSKHQLVYPTVSQLHCVQVAWTCVSIDTLSPKMHHCTTPPTDHYCSSFQQTNMFFQSTKHDIHVR